MLERGGRDTEANEYAYRAEMQTVCPWRDGPSEN